MVRRRPLFFFAAALVTLACQRNAQVAAAPEDRRSAPPSAGADASAALEPGVALDPVTQERLGIRLETLATAAVADRVVGFGVVQSVAALAQLDAESAQAQAVAVAARAALARAEGLYADQEGTSLAVVEAARRDAASAASAVELAERRLAIDWGSGGPLTSAAARSVWMKRLIGGGAALIRAQFPAGEGIEPSSSRFEIDPFSRGGSPLAAREVWPAPGDPAVPGLALFLLVEAPQAPRPGDRVRVWAQGVVRQGVVVPASALILADGATWCYVSVPAEDGSSGEPERFVRRALAIDRPEASGYFVATGFAPGERVVVAGGGILLADEVGAGSGGGTGSDAEAGDGDED